MSYRKVLKRRARRAVSTLPSVRGLPATAGLVRRIKVRKQQFLPRAIFRNSGIGVDGGNAEVLAGTLSPLGRLFEIYFVRLIGTPNQESKRMPASVGIKLVVQMNH